MVELLVVIAIIGILASIVLVSLGSARNKAKEVAIKADFTSLRASAELHAADNPTGYDGWCDIDGGDYKRAEKAAQDHGSATGEQACNDLEGSWAACAGLVVDTGDYFCVDSLGNAKVVTGTCSTFSATVCP